MHPLIAIRRKSIVFSNTKGNVKKWGAIAQLVEHRTENPCVPGSIPGGTTPPFISPAEDFWSKRGTSFYYNHSKIYFENAVKRHFFARMQ